MNVVLCRHGATDANVAGGILSYRDPSLNALGREQSERAHAALRDTAFDRVLASPMLRCTETAAIIAPQQNFETDDALREVHFGAWEGHTLEWLEQNDPEGLAQRRRAPVHFRPPGGESFADASLRLRPFADAILQLNAANVLIVAHRGSLGVLERLLRGLPLESQDVTPLEPGEFHIVVPSQRSPSGCSNASLQ
ncbi:MAG TPA: histidine phosphatase family protein [Candidatus Cybelea sp.]